MYYWEGSEWTMISEVPEYKVQSELNEKSMFGRIQGGI